MAKAKKRLRAFLRAALAVVLAAVLVPVPTKTVALYNDVTYESYANLMADSSVPNLFRNDSVFPNYKSYPPVISDGIEYVPLELFYGLGGIKISFSEDGTNFYVQNSQKNKYISFSIDGGYAVTNDNKVTEAQVKQYYNVSYVPLRTVCSAVGIGCDSYNDGVNKIYVIKVYTAGGLSAEELIRIHAPSVYPQTGANEDPPVAPPVITPPVTPPNPSGGETTTPPVEQDKSPGRRTLSLLFEHATGEKSASLLKLLADNRIRATFFFTAKEMLEDPDAVRAVYAAGHTVGLAFDPDADLCAENGLETAAAEAEDVLYELVRTKTRLALLPTGRTEAYRDADMANRAAALGLSLWEYNLDSADDKARYATVAATALVEDIRGLESRKRTRSAYIRFTLSAATETILRELIRTSEKYPEVRFSAVTEVTKAYNTL